MYTCVCKYKTNYSRILFKHLSSCSYELLEDTQNVVVIRKDSSDSDSDLLILLCDNNATLRQVDLLVKDKWFEQHNEYQSKFSGDTTIFCLKNVLTDLNKHGAVKYECGKNVLELLLFFPKNIVKHSNEATVSLLE
jgi:hypothetical protein